MKKLIFVLTLLTSANYQASSYDKNLSQLASNIAMLIEKKGFEKVAIWNFQPINEKELSISKPLTEDFSVYFTNASTLLKVYDRQNFEALSTELKLQNSGLMDPSTAKKIGLFTGVEAIVTGTYVFNKNKIKLWIKVIETESAFQIAMQNVLLSWQEKIYIEPENINTTELGTISNFVPKRNAELKVINRKGLDLRLIFSKDDFKRSVKVGRKSKIQVMDLPEGVVHYQLFYPSGDLFQESDIAIKKGRNKFRIKSKKISFWALF